MGLNSELLANGILEKYWGYNNFRGSQYSVINSILSNKDTFALMPTGAGKSICFQVYGMMKDGICIVISPLIALMRDQIEDLNNRNLSGIAITSELSTDKINKYLERCIENKIKFLYLSPERLNSEYIKNALRDMKINLLVIDEAHCICQWGYDFRPSYLNISKIREYINACPLLALTGSAGKVMVKEIVDKLNMKNPNVICDSFIRENLHITIKNKICKEDYLLKILNKKNVSTIIYCNSRKGSERLSSFINSKSINAMFYHAGITKEEKIIRERNWKEEKVKIMVATSAFGMGINKSNVRLVIHWNIPSNIESYFQEIGRAGRDNINSWCIMITNELETTKLKASSVDRAFKLNEIKNIYIKLSNYLNITYGQNSLNKKSFAFNKFIEKYNLPLKKTYNIIKLLNNYRIINWEEDKFKLSQIKFNYENTHLIDYMSKNKVLGEFINTILRKYMVYTNEFININEYDIANNSIYQFNTIKRYLRKLDKINVLTYKESKLEGNIVFLEAREDEKTINRISKFIIKNNKNKIKQLDNIINYINNNNICRNIQLSQYFNQANNTNCNNCDVCMDKNISNLRISEVKSQIIESIQYKPKDINEIIDSIESSQESEVIRTIEFMLENSFIKYNNYGKYEIV